MQIPSMICMMLRKALKGQEHTIVNGYNILIFLSILFECLLCVGMYRTASCFFTQAGVQWHNLGSPHSLYLLDSSDPPTSFSCQVAGTTGVRHHVQLISVFFVEIWFHHVAQAGLQLLDSRHLPILASKSVEITSMSHYVWPFPLYLLSLLSNLIADSHHHTQLNFVFLVEKSFHHFGQAGLELLISSYPEEKLLKQFTRCQHTSECVLWNINRCQGRKGEEDPSLLPVGGCVDGNQEDTPQTGNGVSFGEKSREQDMGKG
ncbi:hypothetical protein AAY473_019213 [Plecturocebus cupreus]